MFLVLIEKLKHEGIKCDALASSFLRHCGYFLGTEAHIFAKSGNQKNTHNANIQQKTFIFNEERTVFCTMKKRHSESGTSSAKRAEKRQQKWLKKRYFLHPKWPQTHKKPSLKQILGNGPPKCHFAEPQTRKIPSFRLCKVNFRNFARCRMLKTRGQKNGPYS